MALVAYSDDSDLGTDSEDAEEPCESVSPKFKTQNTPANVGTQAQYGQVLESKVQFVHKVPESSEGVLKEGVDSIIDEDEDNVDNRPSGSGMFASIPAAVPVLNDRLEINPEVEEADELTDVPTVDTWKITQELKKCGAEGGSSSNKLTKEIHTVQKKKERRKVQFFVPALSEFADDEEEEEQEEPKPKKIAPSTSGTGLFSLLPNPKHLAVKQPKRSLVPNVLTKRPTPAPKRPIKKPKPDIIEPIENDISDEEDGETVSDFFSLTEPAFDIKSVGEIPPVEISGPTASSVAGFDTRTQSVSTEYKNQRTECEVYSENPKAVPSDYPQEYYSLQPEGAGHQEMGASACEPDIDEEAMVRLAGKRRGKAEVINFINVSADDALLTRQEWMTKALTEEKPTHGYSKKREGLPSQKQKQKHQITYLAHQAKERELELKNNWAQNRMTKMHTQAKYGF